MTPRLSGHFSKFGLVSFVLKSLLGIASPGEGIPHETDGDARRKF